MNKSFPSQLPVSYVTTLWQRIDLAGAARQHDAALMLRKPPGPSATVADRMDYYTTFYKHRELQELAFVDKKCFCGSQQTHFGNLGAIGALPVHAAWHLGRGVGYITCPVVYLVAHAAGSTQTAVDNWLRACGHLGAAPVAVAVGLLLAICRLALYAVPKIFIEFLLWQTFIYAWLPLLSVEIYFFDEVDNSKKTPNPDHWQPLED